MNIPGFPGGLDFAEMMKQAQEMQEKMQREMDQIRVALDCGARSVVADFRDIRSYRAAVELARSAGARIVLEQDITRMGERLFASVLTLVCLTDDGLPARIPVQVRLAMGAAPH